MCELMMTEDGNVKEDGDAERRYNGASGWKGQCDKGEGREALKNEENNMHSYKAAKNEREKWYWRRRKMCYDIEPGKHKAKKGNRLRGQMRADFWQQHVVRLVIKQILVENEESDTFIWRPPWRRCN